jgi:hypothetical protein
MRPRWRLYRNSVGRWTVAQSTLLHRPGFDRWTAALTYMLGQMSRWGISDALDRAVAAYPEVEPLPACLIDCPDTVRKRRRIIETAKNRQLSVRIAIEEENNPRETTLYISAKRKD